jgi:hypothetical protein
MPTNIQVTPIALEAVRWKFRANDEGPACHAELNVWLRQSTEHVEAYLSVLITWNLMGRIDSQRKIDVDELVRKFKSAQTSDREPGKIQPDTDYLASVSTDSRPRTSQSSPCGCTMREGSDRRYNKREYGYPASIEQVNLMALGTAPSSWIRWFF